MKKTEIRRGDIFSYDFGTRIGSIQSGVRPVLVIQADNFNANAPTVIVASITSVIKKRYLPSHIIIGEDFGLTKPSMVLLEQIQTVNKDDLTEYIGFVNDLPIISTSLEMWLIKDQIIFICLSSSAIWRMHAWSKGITSICSRDIFNAG